MIFLSRILGMIRRNWRCRRDFRGYPYGISALSSIAPLALTHHFGKRAASCAKNPESLPHPAGSHLQAKLQEISALAVPKSGGLHSVDCGKGSGNSRFPEGVLAQAEQGGNLLFPDPFLHPAAYEAPPRKRSKEESPLSRPVSVPHRLSSPLPLVVFEQDKLPPSGNPKRRKEGEAQMTWERFELTGAVEDYLRYKGIDWKAEANAVSRVEGSAGNGAAKGRGTKGRETQNGTDDHGDGHRTGGLSLW